MWLLIPLVLVVRAPIVVRADSYAPFENFRQQDATGKYYLVIKRQPGGPEDPGRGTSVGFELVMRKPGSPPLTNAPAIVDQSDTILARGSLARCPRLLLISTTGLGFVGLDVRGYNYGLRRSGDAVVIVGPDGKLRHKKDLIDLFRDAEIGQFLRSAGGTWWLGGGWIDEKRRQVIVVGGREGRGEKSVPRLFRIVSMETGKASVGSPDEIVTALAEGNTGGLDMALDLAAELKLQRAQKRLPPILSNEQLAKETRLRAAVALAVLGDKRGAGLMSSAALEKSDAQYYALQQAPVVLGEKAAAILCEAVRRYGGRCSHPAWQAMSAVSDAAAVPELVRLLEERGSVESQEFAMECLSRRGPAAKPALPALIRLLREKPPMSNPLLSTHDYAALVLGNIGAGAKDALPVLIRLAETSAAEEWQRVKNSNPAADNSGRYSENYVVDAICKIRRE